MRALQCPLGLQAQLRWIMNMRKRRKEGPRAREEGNKLVAVGRTTFQLLDKNRGFIRNDRIISYVHKDEAVELGTFQAQLLPSSRGAFNSEI